MYKLNLCLALDNCVAPHLITHLHHNITTSVARGTIGDNCSQLSQHTIQSAVWANKNGATLHFPEYLESCHYLHTSWPALG